MRYAGWTLRWTRGFHREDPEVPNGWIGDFAYATSPNGACLVEIFRSHGGHDETSMDNSASQHTRQDGYRLLTIVGPYVSYVVDMWWTDGAHGGTVFGFATADMRTGRGVSLEDIFGRDAVAGAIQAPPPAPLMLDGKSVQSAAEVLASRASRAPGRSDRHCGPSLAQLLRSSEFAIGAYADGQATVHVWAHNDDLFCLDMPLKLDLLVAVPDDLQPAFEAATQSGQLPVIDIERYNPCYLRSHCTHPPGKKPGPPTGRRWKYR